MIKKLFNNKLDFEFIKLYFKNFVDMLKQVWQHFYEWTFWTHVPCDNTI